VRPVIGWNEIANVLTRELWAIVIKIPPFYLPARTSPTSRLRWFDPNVIFIDMSVGLKSIKFKSINFADVGEIFPIFVLSAFPLTESKQGVVN
jgi:hypothetical protein